MPAPAAPAPSLGLMLDMDRCASPCESHVPVARDVLAIGSAISSISFVVVTAQGPAAAWGLPLGADHGSMHYIHGSLISFALVGLIAAPPPRRQVSPELARSVGLAAPSCACEVRSCAGRTRARAKSVVTEASLERSPRRAQPSQAAC